MKLERKYKYLLLLIMILLIAQNLFVGVNALYNGAGKKPEVSPQLYRCYNAEITDYGSHDWVFDSACRLIYKDETYRDYITKWLFNIGVELNFKVKTTSTYYQHGIKWWSKNTYGSCGLSYEDWLFLRRYIWALHGTSIPDTGVNSYKNDGRDVTAEKLSKSYLCWWGLKSGSKRRHCYFFLEEFSDPNQTRFIPSKFSDGYTIEKKYESYRDKGWAAECSMGAAIDALRFLNNKDKNGNPDYKYEAASFCFGAMSHYIADVVNPVHVYPKTGLDDTKYETYIADYTGYDRSVSLGGPQSDWDVEDFLEQRDLGLVPILPYAAAFKQAEYTALGSDYYSEGKSVIHIDKDDWDTTPYFYKGLYEGDPNPSNIYGERIKELTCWAVYHTACAILWVCQLAHTNNRTDTTNDRMAQTEGELYGSVPNDKEQIKNWASGVLDEDEISQWADTLGIDVSALALFSNIMVVFAPVLLIALAFIAVPILKNS